MWQATVLTLFPEFFPSILDASVLGAARRKGLWDLTAVDVRAFAHDSHASVDDRPFGGGAGMVLRADVLDAALRHHHDSSHGLYCLSPRGKLLNQSSLQAMARLSGITLLCGRYEAIDQRVLDHWRIEEVSIGDYILAGGEVAAMVVIEATVRLLDGVMGNAHSHAEESLQGHLLEYPHYTQPLVYEGRTVPEVLRSGNHAKIQAWRKKQAEDLTRTRRPDLWHKRQNNLR